MATRPYGTERAVSKPIGRSEEDKQPINRITIISEDSAGDEPKSDSTDSTVEYNDGGSNSTVDPTSIPTTGNTYSDQPAPFGRFASGKPRKRRAKGSGEIREQKRSTTQTTLDLTNILFSLHLMGATLTKAPAFAITDDEAKELATAINRVTDLYEIPLLDEKSRAWLNLGIVGVKVYGTRVITTFNDHRKNQAQEQQGILQMQKIV